MNASTLIARASSALGRKTKYKSPGRMPSLDAASWPTSAENDCSGFVDWCLRFSPTRRVDHPFYRKINGGWFETSAIYEDGLASVGYFSRLDNAAAGAMLVYPDYTGGDHRRHDGHIGIVTNAAGSGIAGADEVIHCSLGQFNLTGDAIQLTGPEYWLANPHSIVVWFDGLAA